MRYAATKEAYEAAIAKIPEAFGRLEKALGTQGSDPFFNGKDYSLVDSAYAPFLQRYFFLDHIKKIGEIEKYPRLNAWAKALMARPSTHSFPEAEFEAMYRANLQKRGSYLSQFVEPARAAVYRQQETLADRRNLDRPRNFHCYRPPKRVANAALRRLGEMPFVLVFQIAGFALEIFSGAQSRIPDHRIFGPLGKFAIPAREVAQLLCLIHLLTNPFCRSP